MSSDILKVIRRNKPKISRSDFSVGDRNNFTIVFQADNYGNKYLSLNILGDHKELGIQDSKTAAVFKIDDKAYPSALKMISFALNEFKFKIEDVTKEIMSTRDYLNINSRTINLFKDVFESNLPPKSFLRQDESLSKTLIKNESTGGRRDFNKIFQVSNSIQPVFLIENLCKLGHLQKIAVLENGSDEEIFEYVSSSTGQTYKTSVKSIAYLMTDDNINNPDSNVYKHFRPITNGGRSSFGLLRDLINDGLDIGIDPNQAQKSFNADIRRYIFEEISPLMDAANLADLTEGNFINDGYHTQKVTNYSRLPKVVENHQEMNKFKRYFNGRGLSNELLDIMIQKELFFIGNFTKDSGVNGDSDPQLARDYIGNGFFPITDKLNRRTGAEKLTLLGSKYNSPSQDPASMKIHKINTHIIQGNSFKFLSDSDKIKGTFIGEAVIDVLSSYELLLKAGENPNDYNYTSIQGTNNLSGFIEHNFGISYTKDRNRNYEYKYSEIKRDLVDLDDKDIDRIKKTFTSKFYFVNDIGNDENIQYMEKIKKFNEVFGIKIDIINVNSLTDNIFKPEEEAACYTDRQSFDLLMNANGLHFRKSGDIYSLKRKTILSDMTPENVEKVKKRMNDVLGSERLMFVLDNDNAGQLDISIINDLNKKYGFQFFDMTPKLSTKGFNQDIDVNDVLKEVIKNQNSSQEILSNFLKPIGIVPKNNRPINNTQKYSN